MYSKYELTQITHRIKRSDTQAFKALFDEFHESIFRFLYLKLQDTATAEDIVQEVFVRVWERRHLLREDVSIKAYLYKIAQNLAFNIIRHQKIVLKYQTERACHAAISESHYPQIETADLEKHLMAAIARLPERTRIPFIMSRFENLTYREIGERLEISSKTVECHIGNALKLLRKSLELVTA